MPRDISTAMLASLTTNRVVPALLAALTFRSMTVYAWSGVGNLVYGGNTYLGVGSFGRIDGITEGSEVQAYGTKVGLSGIDPVLLSESLTDIQLGAPATISLALLDTNGNILGTPYMLFSGVVDKPTVQPGVKTITIDLALETKLANLSRASNRRYTQADQQLYFPNDGFFAWVSQLNDQTLKWTP
jgi:hypothetical protein